MKTQASRPALCLAASISALLVSLVPAQAVDFTWNAGVGDWANAANWINGVPGGGGGNFVIINNGGTANITSTTNPIQDPFIGRGTGSVGHVNQTAGNHANTGWSFIGTEGGTGTWDVGGSSSFSTGRIYLGGRRDGAATGLGSGTMTVATTGTVTATSDLSLGTKGGSGTLNVSSGNVNANTWMILGETVNGVGGSTGMVNQTGGVVTNGATDGNGRLWLGSNEGNSTGAASTGIYNLSGGTLNARNVSIGKNYTGIFTQSGGIANITAGADETRIGSVAGSTGTYALSNGVLNTFGAFQVGASGTGTFNMTGGTINSASWLVAGRFAGGSGTIAVSGGTVNHNDNGNSVIIGEEGTGILTVSGTGVFNANSDLGLRIGHAGTANGMINLNAGGTLSAKFIQKSNGGSIAKINLDGGTLKVAANSANFFLGLNDSDLEVKAGGAVVDSNTFSTTITQGLAGAGSFTKVGNGTVALASSASTYAGATTISGGTLSVPAVSGGGAASTLGGSSSAASNLIFDGGALQYTGTSATLDRNFTIVAGKTATFDVSTPGEVLTLTGGSAATSGALAKTGSGTLSIGNTNAHTGGTSVSGGVLAAGGVQTGPFTVNSGGRITAVSGAEGTLTVPTLALAAGSGADFEFGAGATLNGAHDIITIGNAGGLSLSSTGLNLYETGSTTPFATNGTYTLFDYTGSFTGTLATAFTIANSQVGKLYSITNNPGATTIELSIASTIITQWATNGGGLWSANSNWTAGVPDSFGAIATFGSALLVPNATVNVDGPKTVGVITFDNANSYTLSGSAITLNNGSGTPLISQVNGSHTVAAPIVINAPTTNLAPAFGTTLTLSGNISGVSDLAITDIGDVVLTGTNSYGKTVVNGGLLYIGNGGATGSLGSGAVTLNGSSALIFNRSTAHTVANAISGSGSVSSYGAGTLTYTGTATHTGPTLLNGELFTNQGTITGTTGLSVAADPSVVAAFANVGTGATAVTGNLNVGSGTGSTGLFSMTGGTLSVSGTAFIGQGGTGGFTQTGGTITTTTVNIGGASGAVVDLSGGTFTNSGIFQIGTTPVTNEMTVSGTATLNVGNELWVGQGGGTGKLSVTGGTINVSNWFAVGRAGATGTVEFSGGTINKIGFNHAIIGSLSGIGTVTQTGGAFNGTAAAVAGGFGGIRLGENGGGFGKWDISGGSIATDFISVGWTGGGIGELVIGSTASVNAAFYLLVGEGGDGSVTQTGGSITVGAQDSRIGIGAGVTGTYTISGGSLTGSGNFQIGSGNGATGIFTQTGGTVLMNAGYPVVGRYAGGSGTLSVSAGSFTQIGGGGGFLIIGEEGTGTLTVSGTGLVDVQGDHLQLGHLATGSGIVNLNGGTIRANYVNHGPGAAQFNFDGGTLIARADSADFIRGFGVGNLNILPGDGTIDTNGHNVRITSSSSFANPGDAVIDGVAGNVLFKTGAGQLTIEGAVGDGFLSVRAVAGVLDFESSQTLDALVINDGATVTLSDLASPPAPPEFVADAAASPIGQAVPEPGSAAMLFSGIASLLGLRRRRA